MTLSKLFWLTHLLIHTIYWYLEKDICILAAETGSCANYTGRWYFDTRDKQCRQFYYGGCGGNGNNFETQTQCQQRCENNNGTSLIPPPDQVATFQREFCFQPNSIGSCQDHRIRYYYDRTDGVCKSFSYSGCEGNANNFQTSDECLQRCGNVQGACRKKTPSFRFLWDS